MNRVLSVALLFMLVSACGGGKEVKPETTPAPVATPAATASPSPTPAPTPVLSVATDNSEIDTLNAGLKKIPVVGFGYLRKSLNKEKFQPWFNKNLSMIEKTVKALPSGYVLEIQGHSTAPDLKKAKKMKRSNDPFSSQEMSDLRAQFVYEQLVKAGIDESKLSKKGYSFTRPVKGSRKTDAVNRRVEFAVVKK